MFYMIAYIYIYKYLCVLIVLLFKKRLVKLIYSYVTEIIELIARAVPFRRQQAAWKHSFIVAHPSLFLGDLYRPIRSYVACSLARNRFTRVPLGHE